MTDTADAAPMPRSTARSALAPLASPVRAVLPAVALAVFGWLLWQKIAGMDGAAIRDSLGALTWGQIGASALFTALSLWSVGLYDAILHRVVGSPVPFRRARMAGTRAIALAQFVGFGTISGAAARWRLLPELAPGTLLNLSVMVSLSFMAALSFVTALVLPFSGLRPDAALWTIALGLGIAASLVVLALLAHRLGWTRRPLGWRAISGILGTTAFDTACAAAALWVLWPEALPFWTLFAAYLVALGAGLLSSAPGGVGAFDLTLLALLPGTEGEGAMAALLAFRVIYYAVPACLAALTLIRPAPPPPLQGGKPRAPGRTTLPEEGLARQDATILEGPSGRALAFRAPLVLATKGPAPALQDLIARARAEGRIPALYHADARTAARARAAGWHVTRTSAEALIDLPDWSLATPARRQLRRKLRQAEGLAIGSSRDIAEMAQVAAAWRADHGAEKGLTMGRFERTYVATQRVFAAHDPAGHMLGFASFHVDRLPTGTRWTLDLMRHVAGVPCGTMQAIIAAAIDAARAEGAATFSLASVPDPEPGLPYAARALEQARGLRQFKSAFAPRWVPRYFAAPGLRRAALALRLIAFAIHRDPGLSPAQDQLEPYSIAQSTPSWQRAATP